MTALPRDHVLAIFKGFAAVLDDQNDRKERLVKIARDITVLSKRIIFLLHRMPIHDHDHGPNGTDGRGILGVRGTEEAYTKLEGMKKLLQAMAEQLQGQQVDRYSPTISPGLQEFIEALSFAHYLQHKVLISYDEVKSYLPSIIPLSYADYLLGVSDLTGELLRWAISAISVDGPSRQKATEVCTFVRACSADIEALTPYVRGLSRKQGVTTESLKKIEFAAYAIAIRGSEYPDAGRDVWLDVHARESVFGGGKERHSGSGDDVEGEE